MMAAVVSLTTIATAAMIVRSTVTRMKVTLIGMVQTRPGNRIEMGPLVGITTYCHMNRYRLSTEAGS